MESINDTIYINSSYGSLTFLEQRLCNSVLANALQVLEDAKFEASQALMCADVFYACRAFMITDVR